TPARFVAGGSAPGVILPGALFQLPSRHGSRMVACPNSKLVIREERAPRLVAALKAGQIDAAVIALPYEAPGVEHARIGDDEIMAAAPHDHALAAPGPIRPGSLRAEDLILLEDGHCLRDHALAALDIEAPRGDDVFAATSLHTLIQMVGSGLGVSFLPKMAVQAGLADTPSVVIRAFENQADGVPPHREIVVAWRSGSSRAAEARLLAEALKLD
ncbi:LysR substrate-binding domain-containing protein, partial [Brevundimonas sp. EAKA]|uniref:LysR substrate-binding domain-containing protein n=1 Tax=Brevundimonas sp. EAKA TaxID=1495854 RepID=UPI00055312F8